MIGVISSCYGATSYCKHGIGECLFWKVAPRDMFLPPTSQRDDHHSDDLSCLQHLLVTGRPIDHVPSLFNREVVKILLVAHLGILTKIEATTATNASARVRLTWLEDPYHCYVELSSYVWVAMTYLLHLINNTIFVSKSSTHIHVTYL